MEILGIITLPGWAVTTLVFMFTIFLYSWYKQSFYTRLGIPQKSTLLLFGDLFTIMRKGFGYIDVDMVKKNGKCFGTYMGCTPSLVISDTEMLKEIMVKQFSKFTDRSIGIPLEKKWHSSVSVANGEHWKFLRQTLSPTFSTGKMKHMSPYINKCLDNLMEILEEKRQNQGDGFNIDPVFRGFTMDVICSTGFGIEVDSQRNPDNLYIKYAKEFLEIDVAGSPLFLIALMFPDLKFLMNKMKMPLVSKRVFDFFETSTKAMFNERRADTSKVHRDLLQLMMNAHKESDPDDKDEDQSDQFTYDDYKKRGLTDTDILINSIIFMTAGFDTTATTLGWLTYDLALNPDVQDKLIDEIDAEIGKERPTYDTTFKLEYLDMVVNETLRIHPAVTRLNREATEDVNICGVQIKKGMDCTVAPLALHFMPEYWSEPFKYNPDRFSPENKASINPYAFLPFGNGPRNCIGKRLALLEVKMTLIMVLQRYRIIKSPKLEVPMPTSKLGLNKAKSPLFVKLEPRK